MPKRKIPQDRHFGRTVSNKPFISLELEPAEITEDRRKRRAATAARRRAMDDGFRRPKT